MKYRKKPIVIEATQWFKNGDHPLDDCFRPFEDTGEVPVLAREGKVVRYFRHPAVDGQKVCDICNHIMHEHGWIDTLEGGHTVCYGDWIITGIKDEKYPCKPDIFQATYENLRAETEEEEPELTTVIEEAVKTIDDIDQEKEKTITEWYQKSKECESTEGLKNFLDTILSYGCHDYTTIADAFAAGLMATMQAMNCHDNGGINGYQASWIMQRFITKELCIKGPWQIQAYGDMLYPQYSYKFEKTISKDTWDFLQKEADKNLGKKFGHPDVLAHWRSIVGGTIPFGWKLIGGEDGANV